MSTRTFAEPNRATAYVRPVFMQLSLTGGFTPPDQSPGPPTWTAAGTKLTLVSSVEAMDDDNVVSISGGNVVVPEGLWYVLFAPRVTKSGVATQESYHLAITSGTGTTVHREVGPIVAQDNDPNVHGQVLETFIDVPAAGLAIEFRASQVTAGTDFTIASVPTRNVGFIQRVIPAGKLDKE